MNISYNNYSMNIKKIVLLLPVLLILVTSCDTKKALSAQDHYLNQEESLKESTEISWEKNKIYTDSASITLQNKSSDKTIKAFRYYPTIDCDGAVSLDQDDFSYKRVYVGPQQVRTYDIYVSKGSGCLRWGAKGS